MEIVPTSMVSNDRDQRRHQRLKENAGNTMVMNGIARALKRAGRSPGRACVGLWLRVPAHSSIRDWTA